MAIRDHRSMDISDKLLLRQVLHFSVSKVFFLKKKNYLLWIDKGLQINNVFYLKKMKKDFTNRFGHHHRHRQFFVGLIWDWLNEFYYESLKLANTIFEIFVALVQESIKSIIAENNFSCVIKAQILLHLEQKSAPFTLCHCPFFLRS